MYIISASIAPRRWSKERLLRQFNLSKLCCTSCAFARLLRRIYDSQYPIVIRNNTVGCTCKMNHVPFCTVIGNCSRAHKLKFVSSKYGLKSDMSNKPKKTKHIHDYVYMRNQVDFLKLQSHKSQHSVVANFTPQRFELHYHLLQHVAQCISSDLFGDLKLLNRFIRLHNNRLNITLPVPACVIEVTATQWFNANYSNRR